MTLAVTVAAPAEQVWAWLVQIGQNRGGMYSHDWLENLIGLHIHSADEIREEWQHLAAGDRVVVVPEGYRPMPAGYAFTVARVDPPRALVLRQAPPEHPWNGVWSFHVVPTGEGGRCRLLSRSRTERPPQLGLRIATRIGEPVTVVMTRRMLHGIRRRANGSPPWPARAARRRRSRPGRDRAVRAVGTAPRFGALGECHGAAAGGARSRRRLPNRAAAAAAISDEAARRDPLRPSSGLAASGGRHRHSARLTLGSQPSGAPSDVGPPRARPGSCVRNRPRPSPRRRRRRPA